MQLRDTLDRLLCAFVLTAIGAVLAWSVWPDITRWQHQQAIQSRVAVLGEYEDARVKIPLRQIAEYGNSAIDTLVLAAASKRRAVAEVARQILIEKLTNWQLRLTKYEDVDSSNSIVQLAASLSMHIERFGDGGKQWAESLTLRLIDLSEDLKIPNSGRMLSDCNRILEAIPPQGPRLQSLAAYHGTSTREARLPPVPEMPLEILAVPSERVVEVERYVAPLPQVIEKQLGALEGAASDAAHLPESSWLPQGESILQIVPLPNKTQIELLPEDRVRANSPVVPSDLVVVIPTPAEMERRLEQLDKLASEILLDRLPLVDFYEAGVIREVLRGRGFKDSHLAILQQITSSDVEVRLQVIQDLSELPAGQARRILRTLLKDKNAEVRYRSLSAMATTQEPELFELAKEIAISDRDSRVAELASRIMRQAR
ncbi:MAG: hypothetical protein CMJ72_09495 [Planctomycetaceae bacterium]|nr:hypothetical protein [Planctomycetaceae bacterium]HCK41952.1 hypothetical protein [Planctomycetaceae bacterium]